MDEFLGGFLLGGCQPRSHHATSTPRSLDRVSFIMRVLFAVVGQDGKIARLGYSQPCALFGAMQVPRGKDVLVV